MKRINRRRFLQGGLSFLSLTPLMPSANIPSTGVPLPYATITPPNGLAAPIPGTASSVAYLGVAGPQSGAQSDLFQQMTNGVRGAISDANNLVGTLNRTFDIHVFNDLGNPSDAPIAANSLISDAGVLLAIGHLGASTTDNALTTYVQAQMPVIVPICTADMITGHAFRNVFRLATKDSLEGQLGARYLTKQHGFARVAILTPEHGYGGNVGRAFASELHAAKIPVDAITVPALIDDAELDTLLGPILQNKPELIYFAGTAQALSKAFMRITAGNYTGQLAASQGFFDIVTITSFGKSAEGLLVSTSMPPLNQSASQRLELDTYGEQYGQITPIAAFSYAAAQIAITAIGRIGAVSRAPIIRAIANGGTFPTIVGDFRFDAFGDPADPNLYFYTVKKAAWAYSGSLRPSRFN
jgi:ABC-type branched-subunit amino acid transport system substrate-binding protein